VSPSDSNRPAEWGAAQAPGGGSVRAAVSTLLVGAPVPRAPRTTAEPEDQQAQRWATGGRQQRMSVAGADVGVVSGFVARRHMKTTRIRLCFSVEPGRTATRKKYDVPMSSMRVMNLDCCTQPSLCETGFGYVTPRGESWKLLRCGCCGTEWVHSTDAPNAFGDEGSQAEWYTRLAPTETTPVLKLGPAMDVDALRSSRRSLRV